MNQNCNDNFDHYLRLAKTTGHEEDTGYGSGDHVATTGTTPRHETRGECQMCHGQVCGR